MIRGSFKGFISGWPGVVMITLALLAILTCFCCWCASIFYGRSKRNALKDQINRRNCQCDDGHNKSSSFSRTEHFAESTAQEMQYQSNWAPSSTAIDGPIDGVLPYPVTESMDGMPRAPTNT